jgi:hypothetical protein
MVKKKRLLNVFDGCVVTAVLIAGLDTGVGEAGIDHIGEAAFDIGQLRLLQLGYRFLVQLQRLVLVELEL